jgi:hypothetical protein
VPSSLFLSEPPQLKCVCGKYGFAKEMHEHFLIYQAKT